MIGRVGCQITFALQKAIRSCTTWTLPLMIRADHLSDMQVHINILLELQLTLSASINPYNGIMGVRGTSVSIQIWNSFPFGDNSLPLQVFPLPRSDRQTEAIEKLMAYLVDKIYYNNTQTLPPLHNPQITFGRLQHIDRT